MTVAREGAHRGTLPGNASFACVTDGTAALTVLKAPEDPDVTATVIRVFETSGAPTSAGIRLGGRHLRVELGAHQLLTLLVPHDPVRGTDRGRPVRVVRCRPPTGTAASGPAAGQRPASRQRPPHQRQPHERRPLERPLHQRHLPHRAPRPGRPDAVVAPTRPRRRRPAPRPCVRP